MLDGNSCHYAVSRRAPEHGPAAVCLHGSGADGIVWSYQLSRLSSTCRIIVPDLPGHGRSEGQPLDSAQAYAAWLEAFRRSLNLDSLFILGHSFGGAVAQEYSRCHPHRARGMVLAGTGTHFMLSRAYRDICERGGPGDDGNSVYDKIPEHLKKGYELLRSKSSAALHADLLAAARFDSRDWIGSLTTPALVIWGERDEITPRELPQELAERLPEGRLHIIPGAGHVVMIDARDAFNRAVADFMSRTSAAAAPR
jgi:pimeloyl-ACP methyl ester carboxylesterase